MSQNKKPKDYSLLLILIILAIAAAVSLPSCSSESGHINDERRKTKVFKVNYTYEGFVVDSSITIIRQIDTIFQPGEIFWAYDAYYTIAVDNPKHSCKWRGCPYQGVAKADWEKSVTAYVGEQYTDSWCIDMTHLSHPTLEYEQITDLVFKTTE